MSKARSPDEVGGRHGVTIIGYRNVPAHLAADASALYSRNLYNFIAAFWNKESAALVLPEDDEIVRAHPPDPRRRGRASGVWRAERNREE